MFDEVTLSNIRQIAITVSDVPSPLAFYRDVLGLEFLFSPGEDLAFLEAGSIRIMLSTPHIALPPSGVMFARYERTVFSIDEHPKRRSSSTETTRKAQRSAAGASATRPVLVSPGSLTAAILRSWSGRRSCARIALQFYEDVAQGVIECGATR
jgi:hypothetical protein